MRQRKLLLFLAFIVLLTGCKEVSSSSSAPPSVPDTSVVSSSEEEPPTTTEEESSEITSEEVTTTSLPEESSEEEAWVAPEEVWVPNWEFSPMTPYTGDYWDGLDFDLRGEELAIAVRTHINKTFKGITYTVAADAIREMDADPWRPNHVLTIYDLRSRANSGFSEWNREHVFPQSKLADGDDNLRASANKINISSDIGNLFACDWDVNETKSNLSLAEWNYESDPEFYFNYLTRNTEGILTDNILRRGNFSPSWQSRGETARSQLYMVMMYPERCGISENFAVETMLKWAHEIPLYEERDGQRQAGLEKYQKMRNPFIDYPELGCNIWRDQNVRTQAFCDANYPEA
ncbi:MAG TPA: endonuclease [Bacilli bacterium]|nr:endonuclease [Bacilli bacterium]